uniref:Monodehydroascorbate reductase n=1 Tax=Tanacetum cinerariifolium TaxID=118510 RepID=A0A6L2JDN6_TANCI|nr:monodehydroascorbate reductase [Tanacetum cinerariifolium]
MALTAYADADHAGCQDTRRSTPGSAQFLEDKLVSWSSKKQRSTAISTTEVEYIAIAIALYYNNVQHSCSRTYSPKHYLRSGSKFYSPDLRVEEGTVLSELTWQVIKDHFVNSIQDTMADMNIPANDAPAERAHAVAPLTMMDEQEIGCQLDEQWFNLHKDILRDALNITLPNENNPFVAPPSNDTVIEYVNNLGYLSTLRNVSEMSVNVLYQSWRAILSMINMCLIGKTAGFDRPRHLVLQILWGIIYSSNIDYAKRIWEEFVQSIQTFLTDRKNLATASRGKKKTTHLLIPSIRFTKLIIHHLKTKHNIYPRSGSPLHYSHDESVLNTLRYVGKDGKEIFGMSIPDALITDEIKGVPYYGEYQEHVAKYQQHLDAKHGKAIERGATVSFKTTKVTKPKEAKAIKPANHPKPKPAPTQPPKAVTEKKRKLVHETPDEPSLVKRSKDVLVEEPAYNEEEANLQRVLELSLKEQVEQTQGLARPVVIREPDTGGIQPLSEVQGKGKEKVVEEQNAHDLLTLQTPKNKIHVDQFIFRRRTPMPAEASGPAESPSLDAELGLTDSETESDDEVPKINTGDRLDQTLVYKMNTRMDQTLVYKMKARLDQTPVILQDLNLNQQLDEEFTKTAYSNVQEKLKLPSEDPMIPEELASSTGTLSSLQNLEKDLSFTDQFFMEKQQEEDPGKTNAKAEVQSMVLVPIHQVTSSVPPMTTLTIDLTLSQSGAPLPTSTLEQHMARLLQHNLALEERLDKHGSWLYKLENLNIPHQVSKEADEIVTDAVDWAIKSYEAHEDHKKLYNALKKSLECDYSDQLLSDLEEDRQNKRKRRGVPRTPSGSPPPQPPPPPPPAGASGASGTSGALGYSQLPPPPPPLSTSTSRSTQQQGSEAPSSSKSATSAPYSMAWTTSDTRYESAGVFGTQELSFMDSLIQDDSILDEQIHLFNNEDSWNDHLPIANSRKGCKGSSPALSISLMKDASYPDFSLELLVSEQMWIEDMCTYDISSKYGISHWWFNRQKFYIDKHDSSSRQKEVESHMRILLVVRIKAYSRYGYDYLSEIILRRADLQEHMIAKKDFKNLHLSDFEDLNLLLLQGYLDHLLSSNKRMLSTAIKQWNRYLVIRQRVKDFQIGIESYHTQLNLTKLGWDATGYDVQA